MPPLLYLFNTADIKSCYLLVVVDKKDGGFRSVDDFLDLIFTLIFEHPGLLVQTMSFIDNKAIKEIAWGIYGTTTGITDKAASASCNNTEKLVALGSDYAAAYAANNYKAGNKKWCLPAHDILDNIDNTTNFTKINNGIRVAGGTILGDVSSGYEGIWSSTEYSRYIAWAFQANTSNYFTMVHEFSKASAAGTMLSVRPVFAF